MLAGQYLNVSRTHLEVAGDSEQVEAIKKKYDSFRINSRLSTPNLNVLNLLSQQTIKAR